MRSRALLVLLSLLLSCEPGKPRTIAEPSPIGSPTAALPSPTPSQPHTPQSGTCRPKHADPAPIVASRRGRIVLLRPSDGKELCTLVKIDQAKGTLITLTLTPNGKTVYFAEGGFSRCASIFAASIEGGHVQRVVDGGYAPAIHPNGRSLAYNASHTCGDRRHRIVVRDLVSGKEREWLGTWEGGYGDPIWAPDARFLVVAKSGADSASHFLLDTRKNSPLEGKPWPPVDEFDPSTVDGVALLNPGVTLGGFTVRPITKTVAFGVFYSDEQPDEAHPILELDPQTGALETLIGRGSRPVDFDSTGKHLLYRGFNMGFQLFRYSNGRSYFLGKDYYDAVW
jgi:hypothetical protein